MLQQSWNIVDQIKGLLLISILSLELICLVVVLQAYPIFYIVQRQREEILKLFCSFQIVHLNECIQLCSEYIKHPLLDSVQVIQKDQGPLLCNEDNEITKQDVKTVKNQEINKVKRVKRRQISGCDELAKWSGKVLGVSIVSFILLSVYPIANYLMMQEFVNEFSMNVEELKVVYQFRGLLPQQYALHFLRMKTLLESRQQSETIIDQQLDVLEILNEQAITSLVKLTKNLEDPARYDAYKYKNIVRQMLYIEVCDTLDKYFVSQTTSEFNLISCKQAFNGIWSNGFVIGCNGISQIFRDLRGIYSVKTSATFQKALNDWDTANDLSSFVELYYYCQSIPQLLGNFMIESSMRYYNERLRLILLIFTCAFILNSLIALSFWFSYYNLLANLAFNTKSMLAIFSYDFLIKNTFIISYIKKTFVIK